MYTQEEMKKVFKKEVYRYGTNRYHLESIGKLIRRDFYGECGYDIVFEKKNVEEAIDITVNNIVNAFTSEVMLDILNKSNINDLYTLTEENEKFSITIGTGKGIYENQDKNKYVYESQYKEVALWLTIMTWIA